MPSDSSAGPLHRDGFRRGDAVMLTGMAFPVASLFLAWAGQSPPGFPGSLAGALTVNLPAPGIAQITGFQSAVRWPMTAGILLFGIGTLLPSSQPLRTVAAAIRGLAGAACVLTAVTRFAPLPGPICAVTGGVLMLAAAVMPVRTRV